MSVARHHAEWLSLVDISGPFLSLPVLMRVFPQQLDSLDTDIARDARLAFSELEDAEGDRAVHHAWLQFVLGRVLRLPEEVLLTGQALPPGLEVPLTNHGETLRPQWAVKRPEDELPALLVVGYPAEQDLNRPVADARWRTASPATRMMALLHGTGVPLGLVTNGTNWMLVATWPGEATTYVTWDAALWSEEPLTLRAFSSLLGALRLFGVQQADRLPAMLAESAQNQQEITDQLGVQVRKAVEVLVQAVDRINIDRQGELLAGVGEKQLYEAALTVMMRLVFVLSAEERGLLLLGDPLWNRNYAVSTLRDQLREVPDENLLVYRYDAWSRLLATFRAIYGGVEHEQLRLPAYGGALFDPDRFPFLEGRVSGTSWRNVPAEPLPINNRTVLHLLEALQFVQMRLPGGGEQRRLSFRALDIEQIGHVYEGLLDHTARRATSTVLGLRGSAGDDVEVELSTLETKAAESESAVVEYLKERTGRTSAALRRDLARTEPPNALALQAICAGHEGLYVRVTRFSHLLREDSAGQPVVIHTGSVYVTQGSDRRSTGTHYTPRALTEEVVKTTLDPLLYNGMSEGVEPSLETLKSPAEILGLRVCDPACGSGAFLVQACRYMAERLVEGWARAEAASNDGGPLTVPEAIPAGASHSQQLLPAEPQERLALARRLVAERCLYGVDFNPMAVEMAKLSLWLVTLHKQRPFTFLDHAIKCGDSLLGLHDPAQLEHFHVVPSRGQARVADYLLHEVRQLLTRARTRREELERFTALDVRDAELKARLHREAETTLSRVRVLADLVIGAALSTAGANAQRSATVLDARLEELLRQAGAALLSQQEELQAAEGQDDTTLWPLRQTAERMLGAANANGTSRRPFHWLVEFPEVFSATGGGFDALVGNPPFVGGQKITGLFGTDYRDYLVLHLADGRRGSADLCAYFFLRATQVLRPNGNFGLLAVNTIAEGDTRQVGLEAMLRQDITLYAARPNFEWPGAASVVASAVHGLRGRWGGARRLNGVVVPTISAFLSAEDEWSPKPLQANAGISFQGSIVLGMGFTMSTEDAQAHIARDARNAEVLFPYLNGEDLNSHPEQQASRWVINFWDWPLDRSVDDGSWTLADERQRELWLREGRVPADYPGRTAADFPELLDLVRRLVKPGRDQNNRRERREKWWHFAEKCPALYHAIGRGSVFARHPEGWTSDIHTLSQLTVFAQTSKTKYPHLIPNEGVFDQKVVVIAASSRAHFALLSSSIHYAWVHVHGSRMKTDAVYTPSDVYETFPFPAAEALSTELGSLGQELHDFRRQVMADFAIGLTKLYKQFHSPTCNDSQVQQLRRIHRDIDREAARVYGWSDIDLDHGFHYAEYVIDPDKMRYTMAESARFEIMRRLSVLNRHRYQEELAAAQSLQAAQAALAESATPRRRQGRTAAKNAAVSSAQASLF